MGLWVFSDDCWWQRNPDSKKFKERARRWKEFVITSNAKDPFDGLVNKDDFEQGFVEAWEKAKPAGCKIDAKEKLRQLEKQNNPHWRPNRSVGLSEMLVWSGFGLCRATRGVCCS